MALREAAVHRMRKGGKVACGLAGDRVENWSWVHGDVTCKLCLKSKGLKNG